MKEPELEEERLDAETQAGKLMVTRRTITEQVPHLVVTTPDGEIVEPEMEQVSRGKWRATIEGHGSGVYVLRERNLTRVAVVGSPAPREFENPLATSTILAGLVEATGGAIVNLDNDRVPDIRRVREGRVASGRDWIGVTRRECDPCDRCSSATAVAGVGLDALGAGVEHRRMANRGSLTRRAIHAFGPLGQSHERDLMSVALGSLALVFEGREMPNRLIVPSAEQFVRWHGLESQSGEFEVRVSVKRSAASQPEEFIDVRQSFRIAVRTAR